MFVGNILNKPDHIYSHPVKWFHVLQSYTNNSINITYLFAHKLMVKQFYLIPCWDPNRYYHSK